MAPLTKTPAEWERTLFHPITLASYEERFRTNLVGVWTTQSGTMTPMETDMVFRSDHTGTVQEYGPFGAVRSTTHFDWVENGEFSLRARVTNVEDEADEFDEEDDDLIDEPDDDGWALLTYRFVEGEGYSRPEIFLKLHWHLTFRDAFCLAH
jgi:hypothetical protein